MNNSEKNKSFVSAIIYVRNCAEWIEEFLRDISDYFENSFENSEIICVNDCSADGSPELVKKVSADCIRCPVTMINLNHFHGLEAAMNAGQDLAIGDYIFEFDNISFDFDISEVNRVFRHAVSGYDIVSASPYRRKKLSSSVFYYLLNRYTYGGFTFDTESFRVLSRRAVNRVRSINSDIPYRKAVYANCGLKTDILRYDPHMGVRTAVKDKSENRYRFSLGVDALILFTNLGYRTAITMTVTMIILTLFFIAYSLLFFFLGHTIEGWTTIVLFLSVSFMGLFGILAVIIKYLQIIVGLVFKRKKYSFESVEKLNKT